MSERISPCCKAGTVRMFPMTGVDGEYICQKCGRDWTLGQTETPSPTELETKLAGALRFILAFYEPEANRYLDTEAWKRAEASGRFALAEYDKVKK